ncbi:MAG: DoxX family membrane protein [Phycisphaerales bacterium]|nr:MAG: DoxX family membrane protein [Phycisphaerales bacterium]
MKQRHPAIVALDSSVLLILRLLLAGVLLYAAWLKLKDPASAQKFANAIAAYKILPNHLVIVSTFAFPWLEAIAAVLLVLGVWTRAAAAVAGLLFVAFIGAIGSAMLRESVSLTTCGCFGERSLLCTGPPSWCHIAQNAGLTAICVYLLWRGSGVVGIDRLTDRPKPPHDGQGDGYSGYGRSGPSSGERSADLLPPSDSGGSEGSEGSGGGQVRW